MVIVFETLDRSGRVVYLSKERWLHIQEHVEMRGRLEDIKTTLESPLKITPLASDATINYYYRYYKQRVSRARYLRVIVKYLNGRGFIVTAYFVMNLQ